MKQFVINSAKGLTVAGLHYETREPFSILIWGDEELEFVDLAKDNPKLFTRVGETFPRDVAEMYEGEKNAARLPTLPK